VTSLNYPLGNDAGAAKSAELPNPRSSANNCVSWTPCPDVPLC